jgi:hypothetical protein
VLPCQARAFSLVHFFEEEVLFFEEEGPVFLVPSQAHQTPKAQT